MYTYIHTAVLNDINAMLCLSRGNNRNFINFVTRGAVSTELMHNASEAVLPTVYALRNIQISSYSQRSSEITKH